MKYIFSISLMIFSMSAMNLDQATDALRKALSVRCGELKAAAENGDMMAGYALYKLHKGILQEKDPVYLPLS